MRKWMAILWAAWFALCLAGCAGEESTGLDMAPVIEVNTEQDAPGYVAGEDHQGFWSPGIRPTWTRGPEGIYFLDDSAFVQELWYYDFNTQMAVPVCSRPDCDHEQGDCNASLSGMTLGGTLYYYDGNLYLRGQALDASGAQTLYRVSADGTTRGKIRTLYTSTSNETDAVNCIVHRGYLYYPSLTQPVESKNAMEIYRLSLSGDGEPEVVFTTESRHGSSVFLRAQGNYLYIRHRYYANGDGEGMTGDLYRMNIHTGEVESLLQNMICYTISGSRLFYCTNEQMLVYDLETGETRPVLDQGRQHMVCAEGFLVSDNSNYAKRVLNDISKRVLTVFDLDTLEELAVIPLPEKSTTEFVGVCGGKLLIRRLPRAIFTMDLEAIRAGESVDWEPME